jgi:hypothetical protein
MDSYQVALSWGLFGAAAVGCCYYYWPAQGTRGARKREDAEPTRGRRMTDQDGKLRPNRRASELDTGATASKSGLPNGNASTRKRKVQAKAPAPAQEAPAVVVKPDEEEDDIDDSTRAFAQRMAQTQKGINLSTTKSKDQRVRTVKQNSAMNTPILSSDADDDLSPVTSSAQNAGGVADMLEPTPSGPSSIRLTAPTNPQKERTPKKAKEDTTETKKQRQNRQKVEAQRLQREEDEKARKLLEERQRRAAREARGEPARNGVPVSKPPATSAWAASSSDLTNGASAAPTVNGNGNAPLLDTFDAESTSSSNGGPPASTAATSVASVGAVPSEEAQLAQAMRESGDESGWTTVALPKKQLKKKGGNDETPVTEAAPVIVNKTNVSTPKPLANGKPKGFQALEVEYEQRTDADPADASNWDA